MEKDYNVSEIISSGTQVTTNGISVTTWETNTKQDALAAGNGIDINSSSIISLEKATSSALGGVMADPISEADKGYTHEIKINNTGKLYAKTIAGPKGDTGATYVPLIDETGNISWEKQNNPTVTPVQRNIKGDRGPQGASFNYNWSGTSLGVKTSDESSYSYVDLKGEPGNPGKDGEDGTSVNIKGSLSSTNELQALQELAKNGDGYIINGELWVFTGTNSSAESAGTVLYGFTNVGKIQGPPGEAGRGIVSIAAPASPGIAGQTDIYTINYSDNTSSTFSVYNGKNGTDGQDGNPGLAGNDGVSIQSISGNHVEGDAQKSIYTVNLSNGQTAGTFTVQNGSKGSAGLDGSVKKLIEVGKLSDQAQYVKGISLDTDTKELTVTYESYPSEADYTALFGL